MPKSRVEQIAMPPREKIQQLLDLCGQGRLDKVLKQAGALAVLYPDAAVLYNFLGMASGGLQKYEEAIEHFSKAIQLKPDYAGALNNMGHTLYKMGDLDAAIGSYADALRYKPDHAEANFNLGNALRDQGDLAAALDSYSRSIEIKSDYFEAYNNKGGIQRERGDLDSAIESFTRAVQIKPDYIGAYNNLGLCQLDKGEPDAAIAIFTKALKITPDHAETNFMLGNALRDKGDLEAAIDSFDRAIKIESGYVSAHNNLGLSQQDRGDLDASIESFTHALNIMPEHAEVNYNMGNALRDKGLLDDAIDSYERALDIKPQFADAHINLFYILLRKGETARALEEHEWRWQGPTDTFPTRMRQYTQPQWDGVADLSGKTLLVWPEQGIGDVINWCSFLPELSAYTDQCIVEVKAKLIPLLAPSFPGLQFRASEEVDVQDDSGFDYHIPIGNLAQLFLLSSSASPPAHLKVDPERVAYWRSQLAQAGPGPYIGISWRSGRVNAVRAGNYTQIEDWELLLRQEATFINLQYGDVSEELAEVQRRWGITVKQFEELDLFDGLADVAAMAEALDRVITVPTAVAAIAAGVGADVYMLNWRGSAWNNVLYAPRGPQVRSFARDTEADWSGVFEALCGELFDHLPSAPRNAGRLQQYISKLLSIYRQGRLEEALEKGAAFVEEYPQSAELHNLLGMVNAGLQKYEDAIDHYTQAIKIKPDFSEAHYNAGNVLRNLGDLDAAISSFSRAIKVNPDNDLAHINKGNILRMKGDLDAAIENFERAIQIEPEFVEAHTNLGVSLSECGELEAAIECHARAIQIKPDFAEAHLNLSFALLLAGDISRALEEYEWRWQASTAVFSTPARPYTQPQWDGVADLSGKILLVWPEQGIGDVINWCSFLPELSAYTDQCIVEVKAKLIPLLAPSFPGLQFRASEEVDVQDDSGFDYHIPIGNLAQLFLLSSSASPPAHLKADPERVAYWRSQLAQAGPGPYIGISWRSGRVNAVRAGNYTRIEDWELLLRQEATFINLQYGDVSEELAAVQRRWGITVKQFEELDLFDGLADVAAMTVALDRVISVPTSVAVIAAGVGADVYTLNWRQSAWNNVLFAPRGPQVRSFARDTGEDWSGVFEALCEELFDHLPSAPRNAGRLQQYISKLLSIYRQGRLEEALEKGAAFVEEYPQSAELHNLLGMVNAGLQRYEDAIEHFTRATQIRPDYVGAYNNLGLAQADHGDLDAAIGAYEDTLRINPEHAEACYNMANALKGKGDLEGAIDSYTKVIQIKPDHVKAYNNKGSALLGAGKLDSAIESFARAIEIKLDFALAHNNMGIALSRKGDLEAAIVSYTKAIQIQPDYADAYHNLGLSQLEMGDLRAATASYTQALQINPGRARILYSMGNVLRDRGDLDAAIDSFTKAIQIKPDYVDAYNNLGLCQQETGALDKAIDSFTRAIEANPDYVGAYNNLGNALRSRGDLDAAIDNFTRALCNKPDFADAHLNLSFALLLAGDISRALEEYEWRWQASTAVFSTPARPYTQPQWDGVADLSGKTLLVWPEQGIGDVINWCSFLPELSAYTDQCIVEVKAKLIPLLAPSFPGLQFRASEEVDVQDDSGFDYHIPVGNLAQLFLLTSSPSPPAHLKADPERVAYWRSQLAQAGPGPYIGISWRSGRVNAVRARNYTQIEDWELLLRQEATFINLQYGDVSEELAEVQRRWGITVKQFEELDLFDGLADVAAMAVALDRVITVPTAVAAIAAGVGADVYTLNWRQSPWNNVLFAPRGPQVRSFARDTEADWSGVFAALCGEIFD